MYNTPIAEKKKDDIIEEYEELEFQLYRMRENIKAIAKHSKVLGIEQTKEDKWVIIYGKDDGNICKIMLHDCETPYDGKWAFSIHAQYSKEHSIHIDDIRGDENRGFGSVCIKFLKEHALTQNVHYITGDIVERDWDHLERLKHFYKKHHFHISLDDEKKNGEIYWYPR